MPANFEDVFNDLKQGVAALARETITSYAAQAATEGRQILVKMKDKLKRWSKEYAAGNLNDADLQFLMASEKELMEMKALQQLGIAKIQLDKFKNGMINLVVKAIGSLL